MEILLGFRMILILVVGPKFFEGFLISSGQHLVQTKYGEIIGNKVNVEIDGARFQVVKFVGVPYAVPPIGHLRFRKPVAISNLSTPFYAENFGPACLQPKIPGNSYSEDCLYLNIYIPANAGDLGISPKTVMIFIHSGGFYLGFSHLIEPDVLSAYSDTIVVTMNYRLGPLGFFSTHDADAPGNYGLWDQRLAIIWVKENIGSFGGNPSNMTIFGESAGASSVLYQTMYLGNRNLFQRAIAESGTLAAWANTPAKINYDKSLEFATTLGCNKTLHSEIMSCLRAKSSQKMDASIISLSYSHDELNPFPIWTPQYDGDFVIEDPSKTMSQLADPNMAGKYSLFYDVDLMIGANNYDGGIYITGLIDLVNDTTLDVLNATKTDMFIPYVLMKAYKTQPTMIQNEAINFEYTDWSDPENETRRVQRLLDMATDIVFNAPTVAVTTAHATRNPRTYLYQFSAAPPKRIIPLPSFLDHEANHADELPFVYGFSPSVRRLSEIQTGDITDQQFRLSKMMMTLWSNFAKSGDPNKPVSTAPEFTADWPAYDVTNQRYMEFTQSMDARSVKSRFKPRAVAFWNKLFPEIGGLSNQKK